MYGLDKGTDLAFLLGRTLIQVCVGLYQVILNFDGDVTISIEGRFEHEPPSETRHRGGVPEAAKSLVDLLGKEIRGVEVGDGGTLQIWFSGGDLLSLLDSNATAESYQIQGPSEDIIV